MQDSKLALWISLLSVPGVGFITAKKLYEFARDWNHALDLRAGDWTAFHGSDEIGKKIAMIIKKGTAWGVVENIKKQHIGFVCMEDEDYPELLRHITSPPVVLFYMGEKIRKIPGIAIVGTRKATTYGRKVASDLAEYLGYFPIAIISGLAYGVDGAAHTGALQAGGYTIAVLGSGVKNIYPTGHERLAQQIIAQGGSIVSEFLPDTLPHRAYFPQRNRIISGLAVSVVAVEAGMRSGALITVAYSVEENRNVYAVPGSIYSAQSKGTNELIVDGATPLISFQQILEDLNLSMQDDHRHENGSGFSKNQDAAKDPMDAAILAELAQGLKSIVELKSIFPGMTLRDIGTRLTIMELDGKIHRKHDGRYTLI